MANFITVTSEIKNYSIEDIKLPNNTIQSLRNALFNNNITEEGLLNWSKKQGLLDIQKAALSFLKYMTSLVDETQKIAMQAIETKKARLRVQKGQQGSARPFIELNKKDIVLHNQMLTLAYNAQIANQQFSDFLKMFLNKKPSVAFTPWVDGTKLPSDDIYQLDSMQQILQIGGRKYGSYLTATQKQLSQMISNSVKKIDKTDYLDIDQVGYLENVYHEFLTRYQNHIYKRHSPPHLVLFDLDGSKPSSLWGAMWFKNTGGIVEAYQRAVFQRKNIFSGALNPPPEYDMLKFAGLIQQSDSTPGFLEQDIQTEGLLDNSIAAKGGYASPKGFQPSINFAKQVLSLSIADDNKMQFYLKHYASSIRKDDGALRHPIHFINNKTFKEAIKEAQSI